MTVSLACRDLECDRCTGVVVIDHEPWPCQYECHARGER